MAAIEPVTEFDARYSDQGSAAIGWERARQGMEAARIYWATTVRPDGRPHITPVIAVWRDRAMYFSTGPGEQKARNLQANPHCALSTGCNDYDSGMDVIVEGDAVRVRDEALLRRLADDFEAKYGEHWHFDIRDEAFQHAAGTAHVFEVAPTRAYGFGRGPFTHTRWTFPSP